MCELQESRKKEGLLPPHRKTLSWQNSFVKKGFIAAVKTTPV
jgi:hypothetical protein